MGKGLADKGYQGFHEKILTPFKTRKGEVVPEYVRTWNNAIYSARALTERTNQSRKRFGVLIHEWRGDLEMHGICFQIVADITNIIIRRHPIVRVPNLYLAM